MGLFNFFKKKENNNQSKKRVVMCNSTDDFYDKMFDTLLKTGSFFHPKHNDKVEEIDFFKTPDGKIYTSEKNQKGIICTSAFNWLRFVSKKNPALHNHLISICKNNEFPDTDKLLFVSTILFNETLLQIARDNNAIDAIYIRVRGYHNLIERLANSLLSFYSEHGDNDIKYFLSRTNQDFPLTSKIIEIENLTIYDIDKIFVRDVISGKKLK